MADLVQTLIPCLLTLVSGACGWLLKSHKREAARDRAMETGLRTLLRAELLEIHAKYRPLGDIPLEVMEEADRVYQAYHSLGGNGTGTKIYEELKALPTVD
ncbi:MAG: hypothetical protein M3Z49_02980 [Bifidobacteriales bacterium]|uniref:hypothetical protein n=1 Tax=Bifidobacterium polysaccharolyticum TaxID=2750967 RepID=UPI0021BB34E2|nr:hypothetical protein [Bifidobacterium polysaccharolyticum]MCT6836137.1 hypothetical protein [Bifidobacteriales bacterium]MCT6918154.1 hypothetical protein [Bifidobacteriales bacterium]MCT8158235.1 hypothetical protein [Bifidobacterium polysaccharolyticum]